MKCPWLFPIFPLLTPAGHSCRWHKSQRADTTFLSSWSAKMILWGENIKKGWLSSGFLSFVRFKKGKKYLQTVSSNKRQRVTQSHLYWSSARSAAPLEMPKWSGWWFSTLCILALKQRSCARQHPSRLKLEQKVNIREKSSYAPNN